MFRTENKNTKETSRPELFGQKRNIKIKCTKQTMHKISSKTAKGCIKKYDKSTRGGKTSKNTDNLIPAQTGNETVNM